MENTYKETTVRTDIETGNSPYFQKKSNNDPVEVVNGMNKIV